MLAAALFLLAGLGSARARDVMIQGTTENGFVRLRFAFDQPTKVTLRNAGGILVIGFAEPVKIRHEKLIQELPEIVSTVRRDPDGTGIRLGLQRTVRISQLDAGERVFVDLLPERWSGLPPALPPDVVAELAERARFAEAKLKEEAARRAGPLRHVVLRIAENADQTRLVFEPPAGVPMRFTDPGLGTELRFEGNLALDTAGNRPRVAAGIAEFEANAESGGLAVRVVPKPGSAMRSFTDDGTAVVEIVPPAQPVAATSPAAPEPPRAAPVRAPVAAAAKPPASPQTAPPPAPAPEPARQPAQNAGDPFTIRPADAPAAAADVAVRLDGAGDAGDLVVPFARRTPAAAFVRGGRMTLVFQTADRLNLEAIPASAREAIGLRAVRHQGAFAVLALEARADRPLRLVPEGAGWRLTPGAAAPEDDVLVTRALGADGRGEVAVALAGAGVHWLLEPDDAPIAVVTTALRQGLANPRRYVEFELLPSIQGLVVQPKADGVRVALGRGGAVVTRTAGLALSSGGPSATGANPYPFVVRTDQWEADTSGDVMARYRTLVAAAAEAPRPEKAVLRFELARLLVANGMALEALGVLALATAEDPVFGRHRETLLLHGIAAARARRPHLARRFLGDETLGSDPEAALWLALVDAQSNDWPRALAGMRRGDSVLARYPDDLAGIFQLARLRGAAATGEVGTAEEALAALERLPLGAMDREEIDFARAQVDEAAGRPAPALASYDRLADTASRPIAAEAVLRSVLLGRKSARMAAADAIAKLEGLAVSWRGDDVELGALGQLVRLYGETRRWRDMLATARQVNARFANREESRRVYEDASAWFETLMLGRDGRDIDAVEFLAVYYDFREFAPPGRRGDEIVRRLADRLVEIDLLDQAATLLQHQVDHRLTGAARATVATRLAALRLMSGKPAAAISVINATRLADLPSTLRRLRLIVEAQAQADLHRVDLALEAVEGERGADFARLRATINFNGRRWRDAGEGFEALLGTRWRDREGLTDEERQDVIRAMLADILAEEWLALDRVRSKFAAKMADSPDAKLFETLLRPRAAQSPEFRNALREATRSDTLRRFLSDWSRISDLPPEPEGKAAAAAAGGRPG